MSRQMVLFNVERRKAWRMLQSHSSQVNKGYEAQKALLAKVDNGDIPAFGGTRHRQCLTKTGKRCNRPKRAAVNTISETNKCII